MALVERDTTAAWLSEQMGKDACPVSRWYADSDRRDSRTLFRMAEILNADVRKLLYVEKKTFN